MPRPPLFIGASLASILAVLGLGIAIALGVLIAYTLAHSGPPRQTAAAPLCAPSASADMPEEPAAMPPEDGATASAAPARPPSANGTRFIYSFNAPGILREASRVENSSSPYWFLDSGAKLIIHGGIAETVHGALASDDPWRIRYAKSNPRDTDDGAHPQNIFRLVTRSGWNNLTEQLWFRIDDDNLSASSYRNESNGLLLMSRYLSSDTLYYAGIRVDGTAVIKKKYAGTYYTMAQTPLFPGTYDRTASPDLLPHGIWLGLRVTVQTQPDGSVAVTLYLNQNGAGWTVALTARDTGSYGGTPPITGNGCLGVRTDFMDVSFKDFEAAALP